MTVPGSLRVMHVVRSLEFGGAEKMAVRLASLQKSSRTVEPSIVCMRSLGPLAVEAGKNGVLVELVGMGGVRYISPISRLAGMIRREKPDIVHTHNLVAHTHSAMAARLCGVPVVHTKHGRQLTSFSRAPWLRRYLYGVAARIAVVSGDTGESLSSKVRIDSSRMVVVYNGIDTSKFAKADRVRSREALGIPESAVVVGAVSRLDPVKDHSTMLKAFARIVGGGREHLFLIVGDGPERGRIEDLIGDLGIRDNVIMTGFNEDIPGMLAAMDIYMQPSIAEGLSLTILEAAAAGVPVVSTRVGGTPEIITDGENGVLIEPGDVDALAGVLRRFLEDRKPFEEMAKKARRRIKEVFSIEEMTRNYETIYRNVLTERGGG